MMFFRGVGLGFADGPVFDRLDLAIAPGRLAALLGRSGCGKTTALRLAAGLVKPDAGRVDTRFRRTAMVFQEPRLLPWASARDNAAFGLAALGVGRESAAPAPASCWPRSASRRPTSTAPPGSRAACRAASPSPAPSPPSPTSCLMDEPFVALDVGLRRDLQDLVRATVDRRGSAVLFVTHDVTEAIRLADRILVLAGAAGAGGARPPGDPARRSRRRSTPPPRRCWRTPPHAGRSSRHSPKPPGYGRRKTRAEFRISVDGMPNAVVDRPRIHVISNGTKRQSRTLGAARGGQSISVASRRIRVSVARMEGCSFCYFRLRRRPASFGFMFG